MVRCRVNCFTERYSHEKLGTICVLPAIGHRQQECSVVFESEVLVCWKQRKKDGSLTVRSPISVDRNIQGCKSEIISSGKPNHCLTKRSSRKVLFNYFNYQLQITYIFLTMLKELHIGNSNLHVIGSQLFRPKFCFRKINPLLPFFLSSHYCLEF